LKKQVLEKNDEIDKMNSFVLELERNSEILEKEKE